MKKNSMLEIIDLSAVKVQAGGDVVLLPPKNISYILCIPL